MDSINFIKGYGKIENPVNDQSTHKQNPTRKRLVTVVISLVVLLTVVIGCMVGALIYDSGTEAPESPSLSTKATESIRAVCSVTQYPNSCFDSISSFNNHSGCRLSKADPELIFTLSLRVAVDELNSVGSLPKALISKSNDARTESALKDCVDLFDDALSQLTRSVEYVSIGPGENVLTEKKIADVKTWVSAAMTDQQTCLDGLEEMGSPDFDVVTAEVQKSKEYMSNSLAIISNFQAVVDKFDLTMH